MDIKYIFDISTIPDNYNKIIQDYKINISYITNSQYNISIEQKEFENIFTFNIKDIYDLIQNEIIRKSEENVECCFN